MQHCNYQVFFNFSGSSKVSFFSSYLSLIGVDSAAIGREAIGNDFIFRDSSP